MNKFAPFILVTLSIGAAVGWFGPGTPAMLSVSNNASTQASDARLAVMQRDQWLAGETVLPRADVGGAIGATALEQLAERAERRGDEYSRGHAVVLVTNRKARNGMNVPGQEKAPAT